MNLFLPICRDSFINFEWIFFNWKLPQSPDSERGLIWTWTALHPSKEKTKKGGTVTTGEDAFFPPWYFAPARPLHLGALFCLHLLVKLSLGPAGGRDPHHCPWWGLTPQVQSVLPPGPGNLVCWRPLEGLTSLCHSWPAAKGKACGSSEKCF